MLRKIKIKNLMKIKPRNLMIARNLSQMVARRISDGEGEKLKVANSIGDEPLIITFASCEYLRVVQNWICAIRKLGIRKFVVVALDGETEKALKKDHEKINTIMVPLKLPEKWNGEEKTIALWSFRNFLLQYLIGEGIDFIHSDADAVWLKNPIPEYFGKDKKMDLIISQGTDYPRDCFEQWRFVLCCGLFYMKSTKATYRFMKHGIRRFALWRDSQQASFNKILMAKQAKWEFESTLELKWKETSPPLRYSKEMIVSRNTDITVGVLPFDKFTRLPRCQCDPFVCHFRSSCKGGIEANLKKHGLWFLDD